MQQHKKNDNEGICLLLEERSKIEEYWTEERMKNATPVPNEFLSIEDLNQLRQRIKGTGISESVEGVCKDPTNTDEEGKPTKANVKECPFSVGGKIYFTKPGKNGKDTDHWGTAEFCGGAMLILTAAHCVRDNNSGHWFKNIMFYRAYENGLGQKIGIKCMTTKSQWHNGLKEKPYENDYSFLIAATAGETGWLGWQTKVKKSSCTSIGYPKNYGAGNTMHKVEGQIGSPSFGVIEMTGNPMGEGSSGGAWIIDLNAKTGGYVVGLNSFQNENAPENTWSPYFDEKFSSLFYFAEGLI